MSKWLDNIGLVILWNKIKNYVSEAVSTKQDTLVSGTNIKTVNNDSLLGSGNISVQQLLVSGANIKTINNASLLDSGNLSLQEQLVSGTSIKTINNTSLLGSGNINVQDTLVSGTNIKTINNQSILGQGDIDIHDEDNCFIAVYGETTYQEVLEAKQSQKIIGLKRNNIIHYPCICENIPNQSLPALRLLIIRFDSESGYRIFRWDVSSDNSQWDAGFTQLLSPSNLKTINSTSLLGSGDISVQPTLTSGTNIKTINSTSLLGSGDISVQEALVSGTNIKTVNNTSLLGSGNINTEEHIEFTYGSSSYLDVSSSSALDNTKVVIIRGDINHTDLTCFYVTNASFTIDSEDNEEIIFKGIGQGDMVSGDIVYGEVAVNDNDVWRSDVKAISTEATSTTSGTIKTNPNQSITLNSNGQLEVGGRLGQFPTTTGIYASADRDPRAVGDSSFLITDAKGVELNTGRSFALVSGLSITCKSAAAGSTEYHVSNTYSNRILCKIAENGYAARDEAASRVETIPVVSVTINGSTYTPNSAADNATNDIIIKTETTLNPDSAITGIRVVPVMKSYSTAHIGNGIASWGGGRHLLLGGGIAKDGNSNDNIIVSSGTYCSGNGNAVFGRYHVVRRNRGLLAGTGHDTTNASGEGVSAVGMYSFMDANTQFAVGGGTSHTDRLNLFEVTKDGGIVLRSPNGSRYKITVSNTGTLSTTKI